MAATATRTEGGGRAGQKSYKIAEENSKLFFQQSELPPLFSLQSKSPRATLNLFKVAYKRLFLTYDWRNRNQCAIRVKRNFSSKLSFLQKKKKKQLL